MALFADDPRRFVSTSVSFYWSKLCYCFVFFLSSVITLLWQFPEVNARDQPGDDYTIGGLGFVTSPITWSTYDQAVMTISALIVATCTFLAFLYYIVRCMITRHVLKQLPYNMTRPVQIAFRFYVFATFIWVCAELLTFVIAVVSGIINGAQYDGSNEFFKDTEVPFFERIVVGLDSIQFFTLQTNPATVL